MMVEFMVGFLAVCKTGREYFRPDLNELIDSLDPFEKPARVYMCLRNIVYKRDYIDCVLFTDKRFLMEVKNDGYSY